MGILGAKGAPSKPSPSHRSLDENLASEKAALQIILYPVKWTALSNIGCTLAATVYIGSPFVSEKTQESTCMSPSLDKNLFKSANTCTCNITGHLTLVCFVRNRLCAHTSLRLGSYSAEYRYPRNSCPATQDSEHDGNVVAELSLQDRLCHPTCLCSGQPHSCCFEVPAQRT